MNKHIKVNKIEVHKLNRLIDAGFLVTIVQNNTAPVDKHVKPKRLWANNIKPAKELPKARSYSVCTMPHVINNPKVKFEESGCARCKIKKYYE